MNLTLVARVVAALSFSAPALAGATEDDTRGQTPPTDVKLGKLPDLRLNARPPLDEAKAKRIKALIASLAALDSPDFGLSATFSGHAFAPVDGQSQAPVMLLTDHKVKRSEAVKELVALGPDTLPLLLDALDDKTPTKITIEHKSVFGGMWHGGELDVNSVNPAESAVYKARAAADHMREEPIDSYTVKVGDACFVVIGQIVGRQYEAVRYQPSACIVVNAPTHDAKLRDGVRGIWASMDPARKLFDALLADYATEGVFNGKNLDGWGMGSHRQCEAALRLLYYFPKEAAPLIAARLGNSMSPAMTTRAAISGSAWPTVYGLRTSSRPYPGARSRPSGRPSWRSSSVPTTTAPSWWPFRLSPTRASSAYVWSRSSRRSGVTEGVPAS